MCIVYLIKKEFLWQFMAKILYKKLLFLKISIINQRVLTYWILISSCVQRFKLYDLIVMMKAGKELEEFKYECKYLFKHTAKT